MTSNTLDHDAEAQASPRDDESAVNAPADQAAGGRSNPRPDHPGLLVVDDEDPFRDLLKRKFHRRGYDVYSAASGPDALNELKESGDIEVAVLDMSLTPEMDGLELLRRIKTLRPTTEVLVLTGHGSIDNAVQAIKLGAFHYLEKPVRFEELETYVQRAREKRRLTRENQDLRAQLRRARPCTEIIGKSDAIQRVRDLIERFSASDAPVLVEGKSGTGKELVALAVHEKSSRTDKPFIAINCGALAPTLLENELFGHARGAFTGADRDHPGLFEEAHRGTLFIDEVCEMDQDVQKKFLRVLENGEIRRLGEAKVRKVDVRIVAATNKVVKEEVNRGRFREDLFYRLNVLNLTLPLLHHRAGDIELLVDHYLKQNRGRFFPGLRISEELMASLLAYRWPGNVRELFNVLERGAILSSEGVIRLCDVPGLEQESAAESAGDPQPEAATPDPKPAGDDVPQLLSAVEAGHIQTTLDRCSGNKTAAARLLGISLRSLYRKLEKI